MKIRRRLAGGLHEQHLDLRLGGRRGALRCLCVAVPWRKKSGRAPTSGCTAPPLHRRPRSRIAPCGRGSRAPAAPAQRSLSSCAIAACGVALAGRGAGREGLSSSRRVASSSVSSSAASASARRSRRARADQRDDLIALREDPGDRELGDARAAAARRSARQALDERQVVLEVGGREARRVRAEVARRRARAWPRSSAPPSRPAREHAVGGDREPELAAGRGQHRPRSRARAASTRAARRRSGGRRGRGAASRRRPPRGRCGARSRPSTSSAIAPTVSSIGTSGSTRAGR